ncbi:MAG: acyl-CoA carboxylase subunit epsilon [Streptosporangiaceae bacterium]
MPSDRAGQSEEPFLRVIGGDAGAEEVAAILAVLTVRRDAASAAAAAASTTPAQVRSGWSDKTRLMRAPVSPSPGAWRSGLR